MTQFPIDLIKNELLEKINRHNILIIKAGPGSGKTTRIPLFLAPLFEKKIAILEPRRLAAKLASHYVAKSFEENVGETVGHLFKFERKLSKKTKIIYLTEGTFLKILQKESDLSLDSFDCIILDEFHERHLSTDTALAYLLFLKPFAKILIMSATIDTQKLEHFLVIQTGSRPGVIDLDLARFPLEIEYLKNDTLILKDPLERKILKAVLPLLQEKFHTCGDILIFLPGMFEIKKAQHIIENSSYIQTHQNVEIIILHGDLENSDLLMAKSQKAKRIYLSTNIAESSVTISGVKTVIDSGLARQKIIHPDALVEEIINIKISKASRIQRANRANREGPGHCLRLYPELDFQKAPDFELPEIMRSDLSELVFSVYEKFNLSLLQMPFLDAPPLKDIEKAQVYLNLIGFLAQDQLSELALKLPIKELPPRLLKLIASAIKFDRETFLEVLKLAAEIFEPKNAHRFISQLQRHVSHISFHQNPKGDRDFIFFTAYIDQVTKLKTTHGLEFSHCNGQIYKPENNFAKMIDHQQIYWIMLSTNNRNEIDRALPVNIDWCYDLTPFPLSEKCDFTLINQQISKSTHTYLNSLLIESSHQKISINDLGLNDQKQIAIKIFKEQRKYLINFLAENKFKRLYILNQHQDLISIDEFIENHSDHFLSHFFHSKEKWGEFFINDYIYFLINHYTQKENWDIEAHLPLSIALSDKRTLAIHYEQNKTPWIEGHIQDFYGLAKVPHIFNSTIPLTLHLLGPHKRALQVTNDLQSFWENIYPKMLKELKREYPRHHWPDSPQAALPILLLRQLPK